MGGGGGLGFRVGEFELCCFVWTMDCLREGPGQFSFEGLGGFRLYGVSSKP